MKQNLAVLSVVARLFLFLSFTTFTFAQNTGVLSGTVSDPSKAVVPNAAVTIVNSEPTLPSGTATLTPRVSFVHPRSPRDTTPSP